MTDAILFDEKDHIVVITINRPDKLNSINQDVRTGLLAAWERFEQTPELKVAILTGAGEKAFCAGMDLKEAADMMLGVPARDFIPIVGDSVTVSKPIIAAVNGFAFAGGWLFAQMCDLCIASENAVFGITEAKVGRGMPWAAPLGTMIPPRVMMELLLTGDPLPAQRALEIGFVNKVVPSAELLPEAISMAKKIAANAPLTVKAAKELVYLSSEMGRSAALRAAYPLFEPVYRSEDALEGPRAFGEKRSPKWQGK